MFKCEHFVNMTELLDNLGVATAVGSLAIGVLVGVAWRAWSRRRHAQARPASPEDLDRHHRAVRAIAAADYSQRVRHDKEP
jgi:uncharacterized iron-regulated membrane protein